MQKNRDPHFSLKVPRLIEGEATGRFAIIVLAIIAAARFARPALFTAMVIWMTPHEVYQIGKDRAASVALQRLFWSPAASLCHASYSARNAALASSSDSARP